MRVQERWGPSLTVWGQLVRNSFIQANVRSVSSLVMRMSGMIVFKAKL